MMNKAGHAYFVRWPRTFRDLFLPHRPEDVQSYEIVEAVVLKQCDYESFAEDMLERWKFIEDCSVPPTKEPTYKCLLLQCLGRKDGFLVVPYYKGLLQFAAWVNG